MWIGSGCHCRYEQQYFPLGGNINMFTPCSLEQNTERGELDFMNQKATLTKMNGVTEISLIAGRLLNTEARRQQDW